MKKIRKIFFVLVFTVFIVLFSKTLSNASYQELNSLNYQAYINDDGSMYVIEEWNIYISDTNTLFKNFEKDSNKFSKITDVKVTDLTSGKELTKIYNEMYHVTKDCYYALDIDNNKFEIAWGVGLDNTSATRQYRIEYIVEDAVAKYNDCSELYWQFVGSNFDVDSKKVKGTIHLPALAESKESIKVWGHTEELNGEIHVTDLDKVEFEVNKFNSGNYIEVRIAMPVDMVTQSGRTYNKDQLPSILKEEEKWAKDANYKRAYNRFITIVVIILFIIVVIFIDIILIKKINKYKKLVNKGQIIKPSQEIKYFREFPREEASPAEARFLLSKNKFEFYNSEMGNIFSASLLDLYHLGYIDIQEDKNSKEKTKFTLQASENQIEEIKNEDEKIIYKYLKKIASDKQEITLKDIQKYITSHVSSITELQEKLTKTIKEKLYKKGYLNKEREKEYTKYGSIKVLYGLALMFILFFGLPAIFVSLWIMISIAITVVLLIGCLTSLNKVTNSINIYSQEAIDEIEMWKGLKRFMEDLSQMDKKEIPEVVLWEKYLIYATAFGIADKVLKQLKLIYPDFDEQIGISTSAHMNLILCSSISNTISKSINTSMSSAYSSASGGGGGFSGGGRRRRRPAVAEAEDKLKPIK